MGGEWTSSGSSLLTSFVLLGVCISLLLQLVTARRAKDGGRNSGLLSRIPGPRQYPLGKYLNLLEYSAQKGKTNAFSNWFEGKGPIVRLGLGPFDIVFLLSPDYLQKLLGSSEGGHLGKPSFGYEDLKPVSWFDGALHSKGGKWRSRRKLINPILSYGSLLSYIPTINRCGKRLVVQLETRFSSTSTEPKPVVDLLFDTTMAVILETVFGIDIDGEDGGEGDELNSKTKRVVEAMKRYLQIPVTIVAQPWLRFEPLLRLHPISRQKHDTYQLTSEFVLQLTKALQAAAGEGGPTGGRKSFLKDLLAAELPNEGIYEETMTMIEAGHETTGGALHSLFFFLALHPAVQEECQEEVDSVFDNEGTLCDAEGNISAGGLKQLQYLEQCILECLRIRPPVPMFLRQLDQPLSLDDELELPTGTSVATWLPAVHMNPEYYPNPNLRALPNLFDPGRFSPEMRARRHPYAHIPFSGGPRKCAGVKFAMIEMLAVAAHILRRFTIRTTDKDEDVVWLHFLTLSPETPMKFVFEKRERRTGAAHEGKEML